MLRSKFISEISSALDVGTLWITVKSLTIQIYCHFSIQIRGVLADERHHQRSTQARRESFEISPKSAV